MNRKSQRDEELAKELLIALCGYSATLYCADTPDLRDDERSIGIEVTQACYPQLKDDDAVLRSFLGKTEEEIPYKYKKRYETYLEQGRIIYQDGKVKRVASGVFNADNMELVQDAIRKKIAKLNQGHYADCKQYGLFVFSYFCEFGFDDNIHLLMDALRTCQAGEERQFTLLYLVSGTLLVICDIPAQTFTRQELPAELQYQF